MILETHAQYKSSTKGEWSALCTVYPSLIIPNIEIRRRTKRRRGTVGIRITSLNWRWAHLDRRKDGPEVQWSEADRRPLVGQHRQRSWTRMDEKSIGPKRENLYTQQRVHTGYIDGIE